MDYSREPPFILGTCVGMRGLERGLERACRRLNWLAPQPVAYVEIEAFACYNLVKQMEQGLLAAVPFWTNLKTFRWELLRGKVDFILGGYPCQPFSLAGKLKGTEDPRHLWPYFEAGIAAIKPVGCFFENVRNHFNIGYRDVRRSLEGLGFAVREGIYSAEEAGAPHLRQRLFILALDNTGRIRHDVENRQVQAGRFGAELPGAQLDVTLGEGLEGFTGHDVAEGWEGETGPVAASGFPMGQGIEQLDWEEPRVKPRLDLTINGYDFSTDLLRMAGNGVVEQTAEIAFLDLLRGFSAR